MKKIIVRSTIYRLARRKEPPATDIKRWKHCPSPTASSRSSTKIAEGSIQRNIPTIMEYLFVYIALESSGIRLPYTYRTWQTCSGDSSTRSPAPSPSYLHPVLSIRGKGSGHPNCLSTIYDKYKRYNGCPPSLHVESGRNRIWRSSCCCGEGQRGDEATNPEKSSPRLMSLASSLTLSSRSLGTEHSSGLLVLELQTHCGYLEMLEMAMILLVSQTFLHRRCPLKT